jgi:hypothetical protein
VSKKRAKQNRLYTKIRKDYLDKKPMCEVCHSRLADQIHHKKGRFGDRLTDAGYFLGVCFSCHDKIHKNPAWAYSEAHMIMR